MGLLYTDNSVRNTPTYNNTLKINACSGGIYKTYKESWFTRFHLESELAETLFKPYDNEIKTAKDTTEKQDYTDRWGNYVYTNKVHKEPVVILQMIICGDMEVIAEIITEKDFNRYFEPKGNDYEKENK